MADLVSMRAALTRCGLNQTTANYIMTEQGFDSAEELLMASKESFETMVKNAVKSSPADVTFSTALIRQLNVFKYWAEERHMCGLPTSPILFTEVVLTEYMAVLRSDEIEIAARKDQTPTKPDPLKAEKDWFKFWEKLKNYLGRIRGAAKIPLAYTIRDHDLVTDSIRGETYDTHTKRIMAIVLLSGEHYAVDNVSLWEIVNTLVIDGFGWSFVKKFDRNMDGRGAILALRRQCKGKTSVKTRKNKAYASIASSNYRGIRKQFTFAQYVAIHQAAHNKLDDCNEPIPETKKVSDFLAGIADSSLEAGITCVLSEECYQDSFEATQQFLGTLVANQMIHRQAKRGGGDERNVSSADGGGKAHAKSSKGKKKLEARFYPADEWKQLTSEERSKVLELKKQQGYKAKDKKGSKRKASSTESNKDKEEEPAETDGDEAADSEAATAQGGNEFGRGAHKKAKKKATISAVSVTHALPTSRTVRHLLAVTCRVIMDSSNKSTEPDDGVEGRMELDTPADTCVAGSNTVVLDLTGKVASVSPFCDSEFKALEDVPIATVANAYDCAVTGKTYVLIFYEALYFGDRMKHSLLCPNQLRANGLTVHDCPRQYDPTSTHSIVVPESELTIPLALRGVISGFVTRVPTDDELADLSMHVEMTSEAEWEPYDHAFSATEEAQDETAWKERTIAAATLPLRFTEDSTIELASAEFNDMATRLIASVRVDPHGDKIFRTDVATAFRSTDAVVVRDGTRLAISPEDVAKRWNVGISTATKTLQVTTQLGVRTLKHPAQRRFRTAMPHLRYPCLKGTFYADTLFFFTAKSIRGFKCVHLIGNGLGFSRFMPMELKSDAHLSLTSFIQQHGVMENLIVDNDPTMAYEEWRKTVREFRINQRTTEPYSPWQNRAELDVREIKRSIRRFTKRSGSPKRL